MPKVSVVMTVFNGAQTVAQTIESVLTQTLKDFEFIIVDNASTDATGTILRQFSDPRLRIETQPSNLGQTGALILGMKKAQSPFVARIDADDLCMPTRLAQQTAFLERHPKAGLVGSWHQEIDEEGRFLKAMRYPTDPDEIRMHLVSDGDLTRRCLCHPSICFRQEAYEDVGGYSDRYKFAQDIELWMRFVEKYEIHNLPYYLLKYRSSRRSTSNRFRVELVQELDQIQRERILRIWPEIPAQSLGLLVRMLRNQPPDRQTNAAELWNLFFQYWKRLIPDGSSTERQARRIFGYYLPGLVRSRSVQWPSVAWQNLSADPLLVTDTKFYKNIAKRLL